jgi:large subunit ribosomal protein L30
MATTSKQRKTKTAGSTLRLQYVRSAIGAPNKHKILIRGLGFRKLNQIVERPDNPAIRGMVAKVPHLVTILKSE